MGRERLELGLQVLLATHLPRRLPLPLAAGIVAQHNAQPGSPLEQLGKHLENPWANHFINK